MKDLWDADLSPLFHRQPRNATDGASHESPSSHQQNSCHQQQHQQQKQQLSHLKQHYQQQHHLHRHHAHRRRHQTVPRTSAAAACCSISHPTRNLSDSSTAAAAAASAAAAMLLPPALKFSILPAPLIASLAAPVPHASGPVPSRAISASHCSKSRSLETLTGPSALYSPTLSSSPAPSPSPLTSQSLVGSGANDERGQQLSGALAACASVRAADAPAAVEREERLASVKPLVRSRSLAAGSIAEGSAVRSGDADIAGALRAAKRHASSETKVTRSVVWSSQCGDMGEGEEEEDDSASSCLSAIGQSASPAEGSSRRAGEQQSVSEGEMVKRQRKNSAASTLFPAFRTATLPLGDVAGGVCGWGWSVGSSSGVGGSSGTVGRGSSGKVEKQGRAALRRTAEGQGGLRRADDGGSEKSKERIEIARLRADLAAARDDLARSADELATSRAELAECTEEVAELQTMVARAGLDWARERQEKTKLSGQCLELETELEAARKAAADERQRREKVEAFAQAVLERATREREQIERERDELRQADSWREQNVRGKLHDAQAELAERLGLLDFLHTQLLRKFREAGLGSPWNGDQGEESSVEQTFHMLLQPEGKRWLMGLGLRDGSPTPSVEDGGKPGRSNMPQKGFGDGCTDLGSGDLQQEGGRCGVGSAARHSGQGLAKEWPAHQEMLRKKQQQRQQQQQQQRQQDQPCSDEVTEKHEMSKLTNHSTAMTAALAASLVAPEPSSGTQVQPLVAETACCRCMCHQHSPAPLSPFRPGDKSATDFADPLDLSPSLASLWSDLNLNLSSCTGSSAGRAADGPPSVGTEASLLQFLAWFTAQWPLFSQCCGPRGQQHGRSGSSAAHSQSEDEEAAARLLARISAAWPSQVES